MDCDLSVKNVYRYDRDYVEMEFRKVADGGDIIINLPLKYPTVESKLQFALIGYIKSEALKTKIEIRKFNDFQNMGMILSKLFFKIIIDHYKVAKAEESMSNMQALMTLEVANTLGKDEEESLE